ncbi:cysteine-rich receptor-like protein kinase 15 isoform X2 [Silene latifolia]|uniref:cysteine-rich receptor-like protein kinase 15 isoform X2 n=1 Tax=Silene latifolia TaxID=37657 RepID=UPI003D76B974
MAQLSLLLIYFPILMILSLKPSLAANYIDSICSNTTKFANNSKYETNLNTLFHYLTSNATNRYGYHNATAGVVTNDVVYGHFLCHGEQSNSSCQDCVKEATMTDLPVKCPNSKVGIIWYDECMVRYSNESFFGIFDYDPGYILSNQQNVTSKNTASQAAGSGSDINYGTMKIRCNAGIMSICKYKPVGVVPPSVPPQPPPTSNATETGAGTMRKSPSGSPSSAPPTSNATGTVILSPSPAPGRDSGKFTKLFIFCLMLDMKHICFFFGNHDLMGTISPSLAPTTSNATGTGTTILSPSSAPNRNSGNNKRLKIIVAITALSGTTILVAIVYFMCRRKARQEGNPKFDKLEELPLFKFEKLSAATNNFQESNKLGQGGFGLVYKGTLEDGREVAIKRLSGTSRQGAEEFMNEVLVISKLQHRNLVKLLGCCGERLERMLIYEYMPNKSLDAFLFDPQKKGILDWKKRYNIIEGICRGLVYLHRDSRLKIIHRDLKAANILLDENLNPKISDFGMARIFGGTQIEADTTRVVGTYGYMPPEYAIEGRFSEKSDVFSFGVLLLEIITGKKTRWFDESSLSLLGYVWKQWNDDNDISVIDPIIAHQGFEPEISKCIHVGLLCVQEYAQDRPDISDVIAKLGASSSANFQKPRQPGFTRFMRDTSTSTQSNPTYPTNDLSITNISGR